MSDTVSQTTDSSKYLLTSLNGGVGVGGQWPLFDNDSRKSGITTWIPGWNQTRDVVAILNQEAVVRDRGFVL